MSSIQITQFFGPGIASNAEKIFWPVARVYRPRPVIRQYLKIRVRQVMPIKVNPVSAPNEIRETIPIHPLDERAIRTPGPGSGYLE